jgi:hypothetical protein
MYLFRDLSNSIEEVFTSYLVCGRIQGVVKDNCTLRVGEWEIKGIPQAVRSEQGTRSGHPVCVPVLSPVQLPLHPFEKVGFGRVVNEKSGVVCSEKHDSRGLTVSLGINYANMCTHGRTHEKAHRTRSSCVASLLLSE